ncbi:hypothetical protein V8G54_026311 [Vigna mungo]|uniref:Transmembrane protein n=1 Tax=Vigna mungo TaxID=3915 RepID=A0AAQ3RN32_VIGMU
MLVSFFVKLFLIGQVYLFSFPVVFFVRLTVEFSFSVKGFFILFSFLYNLISHLLLLCLFFLQMNGIQTSPFTSGMSFLLHLRWVGEDWSVGGEGGVIGGSGFEWGNKVGIGGGNSKAINRRRLWVIVEIIGIIWICIGLRLLIIVIVMLRLVFHGHA